MTGTRDGTAMRRMRRSLRAELRAALQAVGWATGWLDTIAVLAASNRVILAARARESAHSLGVRVTLALMGLGMAYMFLAMRLGMSPMPGHLPGMASG